MQEYKYVIERNGPIPTTTEQWDDADKVWSADPQDAAEEVLREFGRNEAPPVHDGDTVDVYLCDEEYNVVKVQCSATVEWFCMPPTDMPAPTSSRQLELMASED